MKTLLRLKTTEEKVQDIMDRRRNYVCLSDFTADLSLRELHMLAEHIVYKKNNGINTIDCYTNMCYFNGLGRSQKENYIKTRYHEISVSLG